MQIEQLQTAEGLVLRASPTPEEWQRTRLRLIGAAAGSFVLGAGISALELQGGVVLLALQLLPLLAGAIWAARFLRTYRHARPTAVVATDHSLRLERLDGSRAENLDLSGLSAIRIGPDGFGLPWRWMKGPRSGLVVLRIRSSGQGLVLPPQLAAHPVARQLLGRMLAASRATGPVELAGPPAAVAELEQLARQVPAHATGQLSPITIPAGWYADPSGQAPLRWWDGRGWTEHLRSEPPA